jgi:hypothetical protein
MIAAVAFSIAHYSFSPPISEPLPNPNGYDDFVAAGEMITVEVPDDSTAMEHECREFVSTNRGALARGLLSLTKACRVPTEFSNAWISRHTTQTLATRKLARAFCAEGNLAKVERRTSDAAENYLAAIKMGAALAHGGVMIDGLVATACEGEGLRFLDLELPKLDAGQRRTLIAELEKVETEHEPAAEIIKHEKMWARGVLREPGGIQAYFHEVVEQHTLRPDAAAQNKFVPFYEARLQKEVQLKAKLAARAFALEKGRSPSTWSDLVPAYLKSVPDVPFSPTDTNRLDFKDQPFGFFP